MTTFAKPENALKRAEGDLKLLPLLLTVDIISLVPKMDAILLCKCCMYQTGTWIE